MRRYRTLALGAASLALVMSACTSGGSGSPAASSGSEEKPVGTVYIALVSKTGAVEVGKRWFAGERERFKILTSQTALDFLRRRLCGFGLPEA